uniref:Uncharacterized protein n=1 Tax=Avena sativa TaxID=4498 RepID=A0ACD5XV18_AVESA
MFGAGSTRRPRVHPTPPSIPTHHFFFSSPRPPPKKISTSSRQATARGTYPALASLRQRPEQDMSSLAVGRGLEGLELWLAGLFSAAELAAAELLLQLSADKGVDGDEAPVLSATESTSPRSATPGCGSEDLTVDEEEEEAKLEAQEVEEEEKRFVEKPAASTELDRRARKRYRRLSDLYAATSPVTSASTAAKKKKRKRNHHRYDLGFRSSSELGSSSSEATRYGGDF